ncbi:hypothetical protein PTTG_29683 [Puccinia triticina 1-1 BBBD Race 1]|uniref:Uncharacterized protein n=1 Tax=Puccinia triticina (isolate 1-1 / race 1 (BBBD)) TaxID=630390 RepID=A0A180G2P7_PUCT1|nr:hypothetical protein PTTG_29683 [Puccinia triticina 1-1 BBBD Race 1]
MADYESDSSNSLIGGKPTMKVPKFTGENFKIWEKKIRMVLAKFNPENFINNPPLPDMSWRSRAKAQKAANLLTTRKILTSCGKCSNPSMRPTQSLQAMKYGRDGKIPSSTTTWRRILAALKSVWQSLTPLA